MLDALATASNTKRTTPCAEALHTRRGTRLVRHGNDGAAPWRPCARPSIRRIGGQRQLPPQLEHRVENASPLGRKVKALGRNGRMARRLSTGSQNCKTSTNTGIQDASSLILVQGWRWDAHPMGMTEVVHHVHSDENDEEVFAIPSHCEHLRKTFALTSNQAPTLGSTNPFMGWITHVMKPSNSSDTFDCQHSCSPIHPPLHQTVVLAQPCRPKGNQSNLARSLGPTNTMRCAWVNMEQQPLPYTRRGRYRRGTRATPLPLIHPTVTSRIFTLLRRH